MGSKADREERLPSYTPSPLDTHTNTDSAQLKHNHADQGVSHPHADERGGVPHCSALHDPGEWFSHTVMEKELCLYYVKLKDLMWEVQLLMKRTEARNPEYILRAGR